MIDIGLVGSTDFGRGTTRVEDAQGTPTRSQISPSLLVYEDKHEHHDLSVLMVCALRPFRGTSLMRKRIPLGPYRRSTPRVLGGSWGGGRVLMGEVSLHAPNRVPHILNSTNIDEDAVP